MDYPTLDPVDMMLRFALNSPPFAYLCQGSCFKRYRWNTSILHVLFPYSNKNGLRDSKRHTGYCQQQSNNIVCDTAGDVVMNIGN